MYLTQLDTSTLSNQNISSALLAHTFTNTTRKRKVYVSVDLDQIAGNGDYVVYATIQRAGEGSAFRAQPSTTATVASGVTAITFASIALVVGATDVVKVYVVGLAGDTTTPDITTYINEEYIATDSSGRVDLVDAPNTTAITAIQSGLSTLTAAGVRTAVGLASANLDTQIDAIPTAAEIDTQLSNSHGSGTWGAGGNGGALSLTYTLTSSVDSTAIQGATVELYAESGMITLIDSQTTNALGQVTFNSLVAGTYYLKRIKPGFSFGNPDTEVVS